MTLGQMRYHGIRLVRATCEACGHEARILVDTLADYIAVHDVALVLKCSVCGSKNVVTRPDCREHRAAGRRA